MPKYDIFDQKIFASIASENISSPAAPAHTAEASIIPANAPQPGVPRRSKTNLVIASDNATEKNNIIESGEEITSGIVSVFSTIEIRYPKCKTPKFRKMNEA